MDDDRPGGKLPLVVLISGMPGSGKSTERARRGERHPAHNDLEMASQLGGNSDVYLLDSPQPLLSIDTSDGYAPAIDEIIRFVEHAY